MTYQTDNWLQLDLPCSIPFYRWLLSEEQSLSLSDLAKVAPEVQSTLIRLHELVKRRDAIQRDEILDVIEKTEQVNGLLMQVRGGHSLNFGCRLHF